MQYLLKIKEKLKVEEPLRCRPVVGVKISIGLLGKYPASYKKLVQNVAPY